MATSPRPEVLAVRQVYHGGLDYAEFERLGLDPEAVLDFSVNNNPYGPSPKVQEALVNVPLDRYPDREALVLRRALADRLEVSTERILVGNGTAELLWMVALAFLRLGDRVLVLEPTFGEYTRVAALMGAQVEAWTAQAEQAFAAAPDEVAGCLRRAHPRVAFLCNPNNPTGTILPPDVIAAWAKDHPSTLFVVDEAYLSLARGLRSALTVAEENILVLRSMTKDYALAGLRLGYGVGHKAVTEALVRVRPPWNVNAMAQAAGVAALADEVHRQRSISRLMEAKETLVAGLSALGLTPLPSAVHFFLLNVGDGSAFRRALLDHGILVRDCASFGLPAYVRIATRRPEENGRLLTAIRELRA